jgi:uncharacterized protein YbjT (DUF2867 family)
MATGGKTAVLIGATGLVGKHLLDLLLDDPYYTSVVAFTRSHFNWQHPKLEYFQTDFKSIHGLQNSIKGDDFFCCVGTTKKKARNMQNYRYVDYEIPVTFATIAKENGFTGIYCISSLGADPTSASFYLQLKGEMEHAILQLGFKKTVFLRPSLLIGKRDERRIMEDVAGKLFRFSKFLFFGKMKRYKPIKASSVAKAMLEIAKSDSEDTYYENIKIKEIAGEKV